MTWLKKNVSASNPRRSNLFGGTGLGWGCYWRRGGSWCIGAYPLHLGVHPTLRRTPQLHCGVPSTQWPTPLMHCDAIHPILHSGLPHLAQRRTLLSLHCGEPPSCTAVRFFLPSAGGLPQYTFHLFFAGMFFFGKCRGYAPMHFFFVVVQGVRPNPLFYLLWCVLFFSKVQGVRHNALFICFLGFYSFIFNVILGRRYGRGAGDLNTITRINPTIRARNAFLRSCLNVEI